MTSTLEFRIGISIRLALAVMICVQGHIGVALAEEPPERFEIVVELSPNLGGENQSSSFQGQLFARSVVGKEQVVTVPVESAASIVTEVPYGGPWRLTASIAGWWVEPKTLLVSPKHPSVRYKPEIWRSGLVSGSLKSVDPKEPLPTEITLEGRSAASLRTLPMTDLEISVECPVDGEGRFRCEVPALQLDLAVKPQGFIPHYLWDVKVPAGGEYAWGVVKVERGGSLAGWAECENGEPIRKEAEVRLGRMGAAGGEPLVQERLNSFTLKEPLRENGFFQLSGVAPGTYVLEVSQPGFAPTRAYPIEVWPDSETYLKQTVVLRRPIPINLAISPHVDWADRRWQVTAFRVSEFSANYEDEPSFSGFADTNGLVTIPNQSPGDYMVMVADGDGNMFFHEPYLAISGASDAAIEIGIPIVHIVGSITLGDEPVQGTLWFGGQYGAIRRKMESDEDGKFEGALPKDGPWRVDVELQQPETFNTRTKVEVEVDDENEGYVEIEIPDTEVFGIVVDEADQPVVRARVSAAAPTTSVAVETDEVGAFEIRGVPEGFLQVSALKLSGRRAISQSVLVQATDGQPFGPIELRLVAVKDLNGRIVSDRGPVAGASVELLPFRPHLPYADRKRTDHDGKFSATVPEPAQSVIVVVSPPEHYLKAFEVDARHSPLLFVGQEGGALTVKLPLSGEEMTAQGLELVFLQDNLPISQGTLYQWAQGHGVRFHDTATSTIRVPELAPGEYTVCIGGTPSMDNRDIVNWLANDSKCQSGFLAAGGELFLEFQEP